MSNNDEENPFVLDEKPSVQQGKDDPNNHMFEDVLEEAAGVVVDNVGGWLLKPLIWLVTLPFRLIWRIIEGIFE